MVERQTFDFVQRQQDLNQKLFMFRLQWQSKAVNYAVKKRFDFSQEKIKRFYAFPLPAKNLEQFANAIEMLRLIDEFQEYVIDLFSYKST